MTSREHPPAPARPAAESPEAKQREAKQPEAKQAEDQKIEFPRQNIWELLPPRTLGRVVSLLVVLAIVVYLQTRSGSVADSISKTLFPAPPPRQGPALRMASPPGAEPASAPRPSPDSTQRP